MRFPIRPVAVFVFTILLFAGCGKKVLESAPLAALARPVLNLEAKDKRVLIPQTTLIERGGIPGVFVLTEVHQARFRMVRTGKNLNGRVEILSGLNGSETLVTGDLRDVHDGSPIQKQ
jgi:multidrug efflux pump subunit AcrA (membrane-fusion protein)